MDSKTRSLVKTVSWRLIVLTTAFLISWIITSDLILSVQISITLNLFNMVLYYIHERTWNKIGWGKTDNNTG